MNAGTSEVGRHFAARHCDVAFAPPATLDDLSAQVQDYRDIAKGYGRELKIWSYAYVVQAETEREAQEFFDYYVHQKGDWTAVAKLMEAFEIRSPPLSPDAFKKVQETFIAGGTGYPLIGTKEQIVDGLKQLSDRGLDGILLSWPRYQQGIRQFQAETFPLLQQSGLR
jgi:alkanesulfonate monooxygenase SsuD/methylene tetrahydromethanopterin reductase-like flavin-dependent oxidoreductase (luciferase family)